MTDWESEPESLGSDSLPLFPSDALPPFLADYCRTIALSVGIDESLPGTLLLAALAVAVQKRVLVRIKPDYAEQVSLWGVCVASPGERKSAAVSKIRAPFAAFEARRNAELRHEIEEAESEERVLRDCLSRAEKRVSATGGRRHGESLLRPETRYAISSGCARSSSSLTT
jgi:hypothetical protein